MTIAEWCLFGSVMLYLLTLAPTKALAPRVFDNANPRDPSFYAHPVRKRVLGAHINGIETFPFFAAAVLLAEFRNAPQDWIDGLALAFLVTRIAFVAAYVADRPTLRTVLWNVAMAFNIGIFFLSGFGVSGAVVATLVGLSFAAALWPLLSIGAKRVMAAKSAE
ncbi:MAG: MAPEG family protein [Sphingomicrobium sp.]